MPDSLSPPFVRICYNSRHARFSARVVPHVMTLSMNKWTPVTSAHVAGTTVSWNGQHIDTDQMVKNMVIALSKIFQPDVNFTHYEVFTLEAATSQPLPRVLRPCSIVGSNPSTAQSKAVQTTYTLHDTKGKIVKIVLMDAPVISFNRVVLFDPLSDYERVLIGQFQDKNNGWSSQNGARPNLFRSRTTTLNKKLRRAHHMV